MTSKYTTCKREFICDGCRKSKSRDDLHRMRIHNTNTGYSENSLWLCPKCAEEFKEFHYVTVDFQGAPKRKFDFREIK